MFKKLIAAISMCAFILTMTSCGQEKAPSDSENQAGTNNAKKVKVGFVVKSLADQYWVLVKAGAEKAAKDLDVELTFIAPNSEADVQSQADMTDNLITSGVDALCVAPSSPSTLVGLLDKAVEKGIKVLTVDTDCEFNGKTSFIGTGNRNAAYLGGEWAAKEMKPGSKAVILRGRLGDETHNERTAGLEEALKKNGVELLETMPADSTVDKGMAVMEDFLQKYDQIDLVLTTADSMAEGAARAVQQSGRKIAVMGFDGTMPVVEKVIAGEILGTTAQNPYQMGVQGVTMAVKACKGETVESRIDTGATLVNKDNAQKFLDDLKSKIGG